MGSHGGSIAAHIMLLCSTAHRAIRRKPETMSFHSHRFAARARDHIIVTQTGSAPMNQQASKTSVPPSVGEDVSGIAKLLNRNLPDVFGEGDPARRRAAIQELYTEDCVLYAPPGTLVGHDALDKFAGDLRATHPHFVYTPHGAPRFCTTRAVWRGARGRKAKRRPIPVWISSSRATARSRPSMSSSISRPRSKPDERYPPSLRSCRLLLSPRDYGATFGNGKWSPCLN
jgi:hypothetical protein